jgi:hypothetical protein
MASSPRGHHRQGRFLARGHARHQGVAVQSSRAIESGNPGTWNGATAPTSPIVPSKGTFVKGWAIVRDSPEPLCKLDHQQLIIVDALVVNGPGLEAIDLEPGPGVAADGGRVGHRDAQLCHGDPLGA